MAGGQESIIRRQRRRTRRPGPPVPSVVVLEEKDKEVEVVHCSSRNQARSRGRFEDDFALAHGLPVRARVLSREEYKRMKRRMRRGG